MKHRARQKHVGVGDQKRVGEERSEIAFVVVLLILVELLIIYTLSPH